MGLACERVGVQMRGKGPMSTAQHYIASLVSGRWLWVSVSVRNTPLNLYTIQSGIYVLVAQGTAVAQVHVAGCRLGAVPLRQVSLYVVWQSAGCVMA